MADDALREAAGKAPPEARRMVVGALVGACVGVLASLVAPWQLASLIGWDAMVLVLMAWIWAEVARLDAAHTQAVALREDSSRRTTRLLLLLASASSLVGVMVAFVKAGQVSGVQSSALTVGALATVVGSWMLVHTLFMLRYAHLYYRDTSGGIAFDPDGHRPDYRDFAYMAFTVGMTFQVSDTTVSDADIRRTVTRHAMLSYLFGTVIVALTINVTAGLVR